MYFVNREAPKQITGAIFDLDGTVLDTMEQWDTLGLQYLREHNIAPDQNFLDKIGTMSLRESAEYFHTEYKLDLDVDEIVRELVERLRLMYSRDARMKPGIADVLRLLKRHGAEVTLATATSNELAQAGLRRTGVLKFFDGVFSCRDPEIRESKTSPKIFEHACKFMGSKPSETIVVEDALYAIETAKAAGFFVIAVEDNSERLRKDTIMKTADVYVEDHQSFCDWLRTNLRD